MNKEEIMQVLPHRGAMLLVDDILEVIPGVSVTGYKKVGKEEFWVSGHFPGKPVFPGVLQIELMAQVSLFLYYDKDNQKKVQPALAKVDQMKFLEPVYPGDELYVSVKLITEGAGFVKTEVCVCLDAGFTRTAAKGKLTCYLGEGK